jgi:hypothetical protein
VNRWGPTVVLLLLLAGTAVAFATTERQKLEKTPFAVLRVDDVLSPGCRCEHRVAFVDLTFRHLHLVDVEIASGDGRTEKVLARQRDARGFVRLRWRGTTTAGRRAVDGDYHPRVTLDDGRTFDLPNTIRVDSVAPTVSLISYAPRKVRPGGRVRIRYRVSEAAHPLLFVDGRRVIRGNAKALTAQFQWFARLRPGRHRLQLAAVDLAGNVGRRSRPFVVRIRR